MAFLLEDYGPQWDIEFLRPAAGTLFERKIAYVVGYARLTSYNKHLLRELYETWSVEERANKLRALAESGCFLEKQQAVQLLLVVESFLALGGLYIVLCRRVLYSYLLWICTTNKNLFGFLQNFCKGCRKHE